jgi:palmitoyltransferase ZDHHC1/11
MIDKLEKSRKHGFERPLHPAQIISWAISCFNIVVFCVLTIPEYPEMLKPVLSIIFLLLVFVYITIGYIVIKSDPTDPAVYQYKISKDKQYFVIRVLLQLEEKNERFCSLCCCPVDSTSKHCIKCGRCTLGFDHHCKWVNNCIGVGNYKKFIFLIVVAEIFHVFLIATLTLTLILLFSGEKSTYYDPDNHQKATYYIEISFLLCSLFFCILFSSLNGYLIGFHIYLNRKRITTYQYIMKSMKKVQPNELTPGPDLKLKSNNSFLSKRSDNQFDSTIIFREIKT